MPATLYARERQMLDFIAQFIQRFGYAPTLKEIGEALQIHSPATIHEHINRLRDKGFLKKIDGAARGLEVVKEHYKAASDTAGGIELPVLGYIAAGVPLEPYTDPNYYISVAPQMIASNKPHYVLQVKGTSMIDDGILDGDFVVIQHQQEAQNGDIVVALLPTGMATLKRIYFEKDRIMLKPANSTMSPIFTTHCKIQGKAIGLIRRFTS
ncbi:transcriptional repressor LexA [Candidatus Gottesmanbacteria bacterium]|nr:transcriptional repressor LexA [Candidatus Gottesmanbacteria bacterium]